MGHNRQSGFLRHCADKENTDWTWWASLHWAEFDGRLLPVLVHLPR